MEHDRRCEKKKAVESWIKALGRDDPFIGLLLGHEDLCACRARAWEMTVSLDVGIRISQKKCARLWDAWQEVQELGVTAMATRLAEKINSQASGANVINIQDHRDG